MSLMVLKSNYKCIQGCLSTKLHFYLIILICLVIIIMGSRKRKICENLLKYHQEYITILQETRVNYSEMKNKITSGEITFPNIPKKNIYDLFDLEKPKKQKKMNIETFNDYLKLKMCEDNYVVLSGNDLLLNNFDDLYKYLSDIKNNLVCETRDSFQLNARFGFYLNRFYIEFFIKQNTSNFSETWKNYIKTHFNISDTYGRTLRFIGKLCNEFPKLLRLSISINEFYKHKEHLKILFYTDKHESLKLFWK